MAHVTDVGNRPTRATIETYKSRFGDDHLCFWVGGVRFLVLNTQLHKVSWLRSRQARRAQYTRHEAHSPPDNSRISPLRREPAFLPTSQDPSGAPDAAAEQDAWLDSVTAPATASKAKITTGTKRATVTAASTSTSVATSCATSASHEAPKPPRTVCLSHIPPFLETADEPDGYFNLNGPTRRRLLRSLGRGGCTHW